MDTKKTTIYDIARACDCSPATVSLALNNDKRVAEATKERIKEIAHRLKYQSNYFGRSLVTGKSNAIKIVVPDVHNPVFVNIVDGVENYINNKTNFHTILEVTNNSAERERNSFDSLLDHKVDGIIISSIYEKEVTAYLLEKKIDLRKIVYVGNHCSDSDKIHYYATDSKKGAYLGVRHMIESGCHRLAFLAPTVEKMQGSKRWAGYLKAIEEFGLPIEDSLFVNCKQDFSDIYKHAYQLIREQKPDGVFCLYDYAAIPVLKAITDMGLRIPDDIMVTGYDNIEIGGFLETPLTTVDSRQKELGYYSAELLMALLRGEECQVQNLLEPRLVVRNSTRN